MYIDFEVQAREEGGGRIIPFGRGHRYIYIYTHTYIHAYTEEHTPMHTARSVDANKCARETMSGRPMPVGNSYAVATGREKTLK